MYILIYIFQVLHEAFCRKIILKFLFWIQYYIHSIQWQYSPAHYSFSSFWESHHVPDESYLKIAQIYPQISIFVFIFSIWYRHIPCVDKLLIRCMYIYIYIIPSICSTSRHMVSLDYCELIGDIALILNDIYYDTIVFCNISWILT